ncbi:hypothetical protein [Nitrosopumilus sp.]|uniref:hypothetical protein n=1 Tax=Nitrosopumilus sp. TaxID=2024843 RepID=UPI0034A09B6F
MAKIGEQSFTVIFIEDSDYTQGENITKGVKVTTREEFSVDGSKINKFHTTRVAIVNRFRNDKIRDDINNKHIPLGPVKCISEKSASGKNFFNLVDA